MKSDKKLILFLIIFCNFFNIYAQTQGKIEYVISLNRPTDSQLQKLNPEHKNTVLKILNNSIDVNAILLFSENKSIYKLEDVLDNEANNEHSITQSRAGGKDIYYYDISKAERIIQKNFIGDLFLIPEKPIVWKITQEIKKIGNYSCFKAIDINSKNKKQKPVAWFTLDIPIGYGPKNFNGLPGLILELKTSAVTFKAAKIELNSKEKVIVNKPEKGKIVTKEEYNILLKEYFPDFYKNRKK